MDKDYYHILQVSPDSEMEVIKAAYKSLVKKYHPDRNHNNPDLESKVSLLNEAYEVLSDPQKKAHYDLHYPKKQNQTPEPSENKLAHQTKPSPKTSRETSSQLTQKHTYWLTNQVPIIIFFTLLLIALFQGLKGPFYDRLSHHYEAEPNLPKALYYANAAVHANPSNNAYHQQVLKLLLAQEHWQELEAALAQYSQRFPQTLKNPHFIAMIFEALSQENSLNLPISVIQEIEHQNEQSKLTSSQARLWKKFTE